MTTNAEGVERGDLSVIPEEVANAGAYVQQVAESLIAGLSSLDSEIQGLLASWEGSSAEAYTTGWTETKHGAETVLGALAAIAGLLGVTSRTLAGQDSSNATAISSLDLPELNW
ncbi:WXG100 family type VII secretion target [Nocardia sp. NPDC058497]|uniref:WXG100 family type VII secretion target n=1 Tax=Nocardia sp. NPDC058497 TaxID=3346529 RepID=UPI00365F38EF